VVEFVVIVGVGGVFGWMLDSVVVWLFVSWVVLLCRGIFLVVGCIECGVLLLDLCSVSVV